MLLFTGKETHPRSLAKAVTWRALGSFDTFVIGFFVTGSAGIAGAIASIETVTKVILYYFHERIWNGFRWGQSEKLVAQAQRSEFAREG